MSATGATLQPPITRVQARYARLPYGWPLYTAFGLFPIWYVLGFGALIWVFLAIPMTFNLVARSKIRIPKGFGWYMLFFIWMLATFVQILGSGSGRMFACQGRDANGTAFEHRSPVLNGHESLEDFLNFVNGAIPRTCSSCIPPSA